VINFKNPYDSYNTTIHTSWHPPLSSARPAVFLSEFSPKLRFDGLCGVQDVKKADSFVQKSVWSLEHQTKQNKISTLNLNHNKYKPHK
jgi:hypothetical protein